MGLPAKSGVGGGILAVLPGQLAIAVFSPPLDPRGNSVRGIRVCEMLASRLQLHLLNTPRVGPGVIRAHHSGLEVRSRRIQRPDREALLDRHGARIRFLQAQGELSFASVEVVTRALIEHLHETDYAIIDFHRVVWDRRNGGGQALYVPIFERSRPDRNTIWILNKNAVF